MRLAGLDDVLIILLSQPPDTSLACTQNSLGECADDQPIFDDRVSLGSEIMLRSGIAVNGLDNLFSIADIARASGSDLISLPESLLLWHGLGRENAEPISFNVSDLARIDINGATADTCPSELIDREDSDLFSSTIVLSSMISCSTPESRDSVDGFRELLLLRWSLLQSMDWWGDDDAEDDE